MIAYVLPTRNRPAALARTLAGLGALPAHDAEVIVVDNASDPPPAVPVALANGLPVTLVARARNEGAAARNAGVRASEPACGWVVMLDDDSRPVDLGFLRALEEQPADVAAVGAEIFLPPAMPTPGDPSPRPGRREAGGLPEVFIGCGVAVRREAFLAARVDGLEGHAGYDPRFGFYAEEYDLAARFLRAGMRVVMDRRFRVLHEKTPAGRSMDAILRRLVRNNAWVMARYAPGAERRREIGRTVRRYAGIAIKERAEVGYLAGLAELAWTLRAQPRLELRRAEWDRFTGRAACLATLARARAARRFDTAAIVAPGKNDHVVRGCLEELGVRVTGDTAAADVLVIGTLSPGPMLDALAMLAADPRVILPWDGMLGEPPLAQTAVPSRVGVARTPAERTAA